MILHYDKNIVVSQWVK